MVIQGLNNTLTLRRATEGSVDTIGGATTTEGRIYRGIKCRISNPNRADQQRIEQMEGIDIRRVIKIVAWPSADYVIEEGDIVLPDSGPFASVRFLVVGVQQDSILPASKRAHEELLCERFDEARSATYQ